MFELDRSVSGIVSAGSGVEKPRRSPYHIELPDDQRTELELLARSHTLPYWEVIARVCELPAR